MASTTLNVQDFIDARRFSPYQWMILALSFLVIAFDGFDTAAMGFAVAPIARDWGIPPPTLRDPLMSGLFGLAVGALAAGPLADKIGRRMVTILAVFVYGGFTFATSFAQDMQGLIILRFLTGLGLGAAQPIATALTAEYCPIKRRSFLISLIIAGFTLGSAGGGFVAAALIPNVGWRGLFAVGGGLPLVLGVVLLFAYPESLQFLVARGAAARDRIAKLLRRIDPGADIPADATFVTRELGTERQASLAGLFADRRSFGTLMLWVAFFMGLFASYLTTSWLPTLLTTTGVDLSRAAAVAALYMFGGGIGGITVSWFMDRWRPHMSVGGSYIAAGAMFLILSAGLGTGGLGFIAGFLFLAGFFGAGAQAAMSPLGAAFYPTRCRGSGVAWMLGIGRFGAILGAYAGGVLLESWDFQAIIGMLAVPVVIAGTAVLLKGLFSPKSADATAPAAAAPAE